MTHLLAIWTPLGEAPSGFKHNLGAHTTDGRGCCSKAVGRLVRASKAIIMVLPDHSRGEAPPTGLTRSRSRQSGQCGVVWGEGAVLGGCQGSESRAVSVSARHTNAKAVVRANRRTSRERYTPACTCRDQKGT